MPVWCHKDAVASFRASLKPQRKHGQGIKYLIAKRTHQSVISRLFKYTNKKQTVPTPALVKSDCFTNAQSSGLSLPMEQLRRLVRRNNFAAGLVWLSHDSWWRHYGFRADLVVVVRRSLGRNSKATSIRQAPHMITTGKVKKISGAMM